MEEWYARKASGNAGEFGFLPILTIDGKEYGQTGAILRMLGTTFGYYDPENAYNIDVVVELFEDAITSVGKLMFWAGDEYSKQQEMQKHIDTIHKPALKFFESQLEDHLGPFISGEKLTIADFCLFAIKRNVWNNPMYGGAFDSIINEHECVQHYLKTIEKEVPMVPEEDSKG